VLVGNQTAWYKPACEWSAFLMFRTAIEVQLEDGLLRAGDKHGMMGVRQPARLIVGTFGIDGSGAKCA